MAGLYYEELDVGSVIEHALRRTITESDNVWFSTITLNSQPLHIDEEFAKQTQFGQRIVNSILTMGVVGGITVVDLTLGTTVANLSYDEVKFPHPVFHGDTLRTETEVLDKRESKSRPDAGIVWFRHRGYNQRDEVVCDFKRAGLMLKKPQG